MIRKYNKKVEQNIAACLVLEKFFMKYKKMCFEK